MGNDVLVAFLNDGVSKALERGKEQQENKEAFASHWLMGVRPIAEVLFCYKNCCFVILP